MPIAPRRPTHPYLPPTTRAENARHALRRGLVRYWAPALDPGRNRIASIAGLHRSVEAAFGAAPPAWTTTALGGSLRFNGTSQYLLSSTAAGLFDGGSGSGTWDFSTSSMTFDNAGYAFDGTAPGSGGGTTGQSGATIAIMGVLPAAPTANGVLYGQSRPDNANASLAVSLIAGGTGGTWDFSTSSMTFDNAAYDFSGAAPGGTGGPGSIAIGFQTGASANVSASVTAPAAGVPFLFIGTISDGANAAAYLLDLSSRIRTTGTTSSGNASWTGLTLTQESVGASLAGGTASAFAQHQGLVYAVWNRALAADEIADFQEDPYVLFREPMEDTWLQSPGSTAQGALVSSAWSLSSIGTASGGGSAPGTTLATAWTLQGGQATASSVATGATLTTNWSLFPLSQVGGQTLTTAWSLSATGTATASSQTPAGLVTSNWFFVPGTATASNAGTAPGTTLTTTWALSRVGTANGPVPGQLLTTAWTLTPGTAGSYNPPVPGQGPRPGGGGWGPGRPGGGFGRDEDPEKRRKRREKLESDYERASDPEGWTRREAEKRAAEEKAAAAAEELRTRPDRIGQSVLRFLNLTDWD